LTGALYVEGVIDPDAPATHHGAADEIEVPTKPSTADALAEMADEIPGLMTDLRATASSLAQLAASADVQNVVGDYRDVGLDARKALAHADEVFTSIQDMLAEQSNLQIRVADAMEEVANAMRSIRQLADMLERQPEALIKGKSSPEDR